MKPLAGKVLAIPNATNLNKNLAQTQNSSGDTTWIKRKKKQGVATLPSRNSLPPGHVGSIPENLGRGDVTYIPKVSGKTEQIVTYSLGEEGKMNDMVMFNTPLEHVLAVGSLSESDYAFIRRSGGKFCFAMVISIHPRPDSLYMEVLVNETGGTKSIPFFQWENYIRPIKPYVTCRQIPSRGKSFMVKGQYIEKIERGSGTKAQSGNLPRLLRKNQHINRSSSVESFSYNQDKERHMSCRCSLNKCVSVADLVSWKNVTNNDANFPRESICESRNIAPHDHNENNVVSNVGSHESVLRLSSPASAVGLNKSMVDKTCLSQSILESIKLCADDIIHDHVCSNGEVNHESTNRLDIKRSRISSLESSTRVSSSGGLSAEEILDNGYTSRRVSWNTCGLSCTNSIGSMFNEGRNFRSESEPTFPDNIIHRRSMTHKVTSAESKDIHKQHLRRSTIGTDFHVNQLNAAYAKKRFPRRASTDSGFNERHLLSAFATIPRPPLDAKRH